MQVAKILGYLAWNNFNIKLARQTSHDEKPKYKKAKTLADEAISILNKLKAEKILQVEATNVSFFGGRL